MTRATEFEFRHRFWIFAALFGAAFAAYFIDRRSTAFTLAGEHVRILLAMGAGLVAVGAALRTWASAYLHTRIVHDTALHTTQLVADGPYRHLRNPLYLGVIFVALGFSLLAPPLGCAVLVIGCALFTLRLIGREESELALRQGGAYLEFTRRVPRLLPAVRPRLPPSGAAPAWRQAIVGELFMWGCALALAGYVWSRDLRVMWALMAVAFAARLPWRLVSAR